MEPFKDALYREISTGDIVFIKEKTCLMVGKVVVNSQGKQAFESHAFAEVMDSWLKEYPEEAFPMDLSVFKNKEGRLLDFYIIGIDALHMDRLQMDFILENFNPKTIDEFGFFVETDIYTIKKQLAA